MKKVICIVSVLLNIFTLSFIIIYSISSYHNYKLKQEEYYGAKQFATDFVTLVNTITLNNDRDLNQYRNTPINMLPAVFDGAYQQFFNTKNNYSEYYKAINGKYTTSIEISDIKVDKDKTITVYFDKLYQDTKTKKVTQKVAMFTTIWYWYTPSINDKNISLPYRYHVTAYVQNILQ
ncbi:hypothetical protein ACFX5K_03525 [Rickettsiales bacterium LUAb2]